MVKISVIIPIYNTATYLRRCLNSVCHQTLEDIEIICINDGSIDDSLKILKEYQAKDMRIKLINFKKNKGVSVARNKGLDIACGEYVGFVDSDDFIDLDFYEKLYNKAIGTNADAVKARLLEIGDNSLVGKIIPNYNLNELISEHPAYFYYTFTTAIYNRKFLIEHDIRFPENLCHMEDNWFTIKAGLYYKNLQIIDNSNYYYYMPTINKVPKKDHFTVCKDATIAASKIIELINNAAISKEHYMIVYTFIIKQILDFMQNEQDEDIFSILGENLNLLCSLCKYQNEINTFIISTTKKLNDTYEKQKEHLLQYSKVSPVEILSKYKKYSKYLNGTSVKILVSYIKPSFLFKTDILVPIHLGRAVEYASSKDGIQSQTNIDWLHKNCIGDDDFEGNISLVNRRVGFLTGTFWAWKNYEKLGNPDYFGFCAHRKLLTPEILLHIDDVDLILPEKFHTAPNIEQHYVMRHSVTRWNILLDAIKKIHPEDYIPFIKWSRQDYINFYEIYVMKKHLFFEYCEWIFPLLFELISLPEERFAFTPKDKEKILDFYKYEDYYNVCNEKNFDSYQQRDIGYLIERITGYYMYKLQQNKNIKYSEAEILFVEDFYDKLNIMRGNVKNDFTGINRKN